MPKAKSTATQKPAKAASGKTKAARSTAGISKSAPKLYSTFAALPLDLPSPVPIASSSRSASAASTATHYLFVRPHNPKAGAATEDELRTVGRTLFVANVPADAAERDLRTVFGRWGVVESVTITAEGQGGNVLEQAVRGIEESDDEDSDDDDEDEDEDEVKEGEDDKAEPTFVGKAEPKLPRSQRKRRKPNTLPPSVPDVTPLPDLCPRSSAFGSSGGRSARVVFVDAVSISRVMAHNSTEHISLAAYGSEEPTGLAFFEAQYAALRPPLAIVKAHADTSLARYDHLHSLLLASRAKAHGAGALVDEDGFTVVVRGGRYGRTAGRGGDPSGAGVAVASRSVANDAAAKKKGNGAGPLTDFYQFQKVDRKRKGELFFRGHQLTMQNWPTCARASTRTRRRSRHSRRAAVSSPTRQCCYVTRVLCDFFGAVHSGARPCINATIMQVVSRPLPGFPLLHSCTPPSQLSTQLYSSFLNLSSAFSLLPSALSWRTLAPSRARWDACSMARSTSTTSAGRRSNAFLRSGTSAVVIIMPG